MPIDVREALQRCELVVVSDCISRYRYHASGAHVKLPALGWGEKDGTVTNSERRISRQRSFLPALGRRAGLVDALAEVGKRMGLLSPLFDLNRRCHIP
jgi:assimilatory nitrate reductase catalytic subunit